MHKVIAKYAILLLLAALLVVALVWAHHKAEGQRCTALAVRIDNRDSLSFVTERGVRAELERLGIRPVGLFYRDIDATLIEKALRQSEYIENVECFKTPGGTVVVRASQLVPVMRVFDGDASYYVNATGKRMTATASYHIDVPVVQGHFTTDFPPTRLLPLIDYVEHDSLLRSLVTMINVENPNNVYSVPAIYGHVVNIGPPTGIDAKFEKLKQFYREVLPYKGWETYDTISVKWSHQVVATRRAKTKKVEVEYSWETDEADPDMQTIGADEHSRAINAPVPQTNETN